jgi:hypothetical protein
MLGFIIASARVFMSDRNRHLEAFESGEPEWRHSARLGVPLRTKPQGNESDRQRVANAE